VIVFASALTFFFVNLAPGGPASIMRFDVSPEQREALIRLMGLDRPVPERYVEWLASALRGDLGTSLLTNEPVVTRIGDRLPNTLTLAEPRSSSRSSPASRSASCRPCAAESRSITS